MAEPGWRCSLSRNERGTRSPRCAGAGGSPGRSFYRYRRRYEAEGPEGPRSAVQAAPGVPRADRRPSRGWRSAGFERIIPGGGARGIRAELHRAGVDSPAVSNHPPGPPWKPSGLITRRSGPHQGISDLTPAERCTPSPAPPPADHQELEEPVYPPGAIVRTVLSVGVVTYDRRTIGLGRRWPGLKVRIVPAGKLIHVYYGKPCCGRWPSIPTAGTTRRIGAWR